MCDQLYTDSYCEADLQIFKVSLKDRRDLGSKSQTWILNGILLIAGKCITCHYNTTGHHCDKCLPGFEGDPLKNISCKWIGMFFLIIVRKP